MKESFDKWYEATPMTQDWYEKPLVSDVPKSWAECAWNHQQEKIEKLEAEVEGFRKFRDECSAIIGRME